MGFTLVELLVVIAIISIIAGFLIPTLLRGRVEAYKVQCQNNLKEIAKLAMIYADSSGTRFFPHGRSNPQAHDSLNVMVEFFGGDMKPQMFQCPEWREGKAEKDSDGKFILEANTCAYTWSKMKLSPTDSGRAISSDKYIKTTDQLSGHDKGMNVVYTDTAVSFVLEKDIDGEDGLMKGLVR
ncbi:MAG: prepilin-type N-terminal cleavage/methylation domain-containing protein [Planctomycetes bacterium]|nr:prepilin-type N-terminal cleavage/methylation domain-containing protein [Planctomycetota bacterium]